MRPLRLAAAALVAAHLGCKSAHPVGPRKEAPRTATFPHEKHADLDCVDCHAEVATSTRLGQAALPRAATCQECHDPASMTPAERAAHEPPAAREPSERSITFDHAAHLARIQAKGNDACRTCHASERLPEPGPPRDPTPPMSACTACHHHEEEVAAARCTPCHVSLRRFPLRPIQALAGLSHRGDFVRRHGRLVGNSAETCAQCHDQTYCAKCHANATLPFRPELQFPEDVKTDFIHRGDFVSRHHIEAAADPAGCRKCHGSFFCDSCHQAQNVSPRVAIRGGSPRDPHPAGWASGAQHGTAARQNIVGCASCHDQSGPANLCARCHGSSGPGLPGIGGSPHPPGFAGKHGRDEIRRNSMCRACHANG